MHRHSALSFPPPHPTARSLRPFTSPASRMQLLCSSPPQLLPQLPVTDTGHRKTRTNNNPLESLQVHGLLARTLRVSMCFTTLPNVAASATSGYPFPPFHFFGSSPRAVSAILRNKMCIAKSEPIQHAIIRHLQHICIFHCFPSPCNINNCWSV